MAKLDGIIEDAMSLQAINNPFVGQSQGIVRQQEIADFSRKNRIIAGPGVRITQTEQGQVIEACNISKTTTYTGSSKVADAVVGTIGAVLNDGSYTISFNESDEPVKYNMAYEINSLVDVVDTYNEDDKILCFPVLMPEVAMGEI